MSELAGRPAGALKYDRRAGQRRPLARAGGLGGCGCDWLGAASTTFAPLLQTDLQSFARPWPSNA